MAYLEVIFRRCYRYIVCGTHYLGWVTLGYAAQPGFGRHDRHPRLGVTESLTSHSWWSTVNLCKTLIDLVTPPAFKARGKSYIYSTWYKHNSFHITYLYLKMKRGRKEKKLISKGKKENITKAFKIWILRSLWSHVDLMNQGLFQSLESSNRYILLFECTSCIVVHYLAYLHIKGFSDSTQLL